MFRPDQADAGAKPAYAAPGPAVPPNDHFVNGTVLTVDQANHAIEELVSIATLNGAALNKADDTQCRTALSAVRALKDDPAAPLDTGSVSSTRNRVVISSTTSRSSGANSAAIAALDGLASGAQAAVVGGTAGTASANNTAVLGGDTCAASVIRSTVVGGLNNAASAADAAVHGGTGNTASQVAAAVVGGASNAASQVNAAVVGGTTNVASGANSASIGGATHTVSGASAAVIGGNGNIASGLDSATLGGDTITASGDAAVAVGGDANVASGVNSATVGGNDLLADGIHAACLGGITNQAAGDHAATVGGSGNIVSALGDHGVAVGGQTNQVTGLDSVAIGGQSNVVSGARSVILGGHDTTIAPNDTIGGGIGGAGGVSFRVDLATGTIYADSAGVTVPADYAEMFENATSSPIPVGRLVAPDGLEGKVRLAAPGDTILGVVSAHPAHIGNAPQYWHGTYQQDEWGRPIMVDYRRQTSADFDPKREYVPRERRRAEWTCVGLLGQIRVAVADWVRSGDSIVPGEDGIGVCGHGFRGRAIRCMRILYPYTDERGHAIALCMVG